MIGNLRVRQADLSNQPPEIRVRVVEGLNDIHHLAVVEAEPGVVLVGLGIGQPVNQTIKPLANPEHQRVLAARFLNCDHNRGALLPFIEHLWNQFRRVLKVRDDANDGISRCLVEGMHGRTDVAEIAGIGDNLHVVVGRGNLLENCYGAVARGIVDEDVLVPVASDLAHHRPDPLVQLAHVVFFVEARELRWLSTSSFLLN